MECNENNRGAVSEKDRPPEWNHPEGPRKTQGANPENAHLLARAD